MAAMCHFWRLTPPEYWALTLEEQDALLRYMQRREKAERAAGAG